LDLSIYVAKSSSFLVVCVFQEEEMQYKVKHPVVNPSHCLSVHRIHSVIPQSTQERHSITPPVASKRLVTRPRHGGTGHSLLLAESAFPLSGGRVLNRDRHSRFWAAAWIARSQYWISILCNINKQTLSIQAPQRHHCSPIAEYNPP